MKLRIPGMRWSQWSRSLKPNQQWYIQPSNDACWMLKFPPRRTLCVNNDFCAFRKKNTCYEVSNYCNTGILIQLPSKLPSTITLILILLIEAIDWDMFKFSQGLHVMNIKVLLRVMICGKHSIISIWSHILKPYKATIFRWLSRATAHLSLFSFAWKSHWVSLSMGLQFSGGSLWQWGLPQISCKKCGFILYIGFMDNYTMSTPD